MIDLNKSLTQLEIILKEKTDEVVFFEVSESVASPFEDFVWGKNMAIPIMTTHMVDKVVNGDEADINISSILKGMVHILGIDSSFVHRDFYLDFMRRADVDFYKRIYSDALYLADNKKFLDSLIRLRAALLFVEKFISDECSDYNIREDILYNCGRLCEYLFYQYNDSSKVVNDEKSDNLDGCNSRKEIFEASMLYYFNRVLAGNSNHGLVQYHMGFYYLRNKNYSEAKKMLVQSLELGKLDEQQRGEILRALRSLEDELIYEKGYRAVIEGFEDEGLSYLLPLADEYPDWWNVYFFIGLAYRKKQMFVEAIEHFNKVLNLNTGHIDSMNEIAICYISVEDTESAQKYLQEALRLSPMNHEILCNMGILELQKGNIAKAKMYIDKAFEIEPKDEVTNAWKEHLSSL